MNASETTGYQSLQFSDGELVLLYHEEDDGNRFWYGGEETFHRADISDGTVTFVRLMPDGKLFPPEDTHIEFEKDKLSSTLLGDLSCRHIVKINGGNWKTQSYTIPLPETINAIQREKLIPLGAHDLPHRLLDGDGYDEQFKATTITESLASGFIPVSTTARYLLHDIGAHSLGMASIESWTMEVVCALAQLAVDLQVDSPAEAYELSVAIARALDITTFSNEQRHPLQLRPSRRDKLINYILAFSVDQPEPVRTSIIDYVYGAGFTIKHNGDVMRPKDIRDYYKNLEELVMGETPDNERTNH